MYIMFNHEPINQFTESFYEKKEEIWLSPMTKAPTPTEKSKGNVST